MAVKTTKATDKETPSTSPGAGYCAYIGPSIRGAIQTMTIYPGDKAAVLEDAAVAMAVSRFPLIADLIIDGADLNQSRADVTTKGTALYHTYHAVTERK